MSIAQRLVNLSDGLSAEGILSAAKGGTGTTTGAGSSTPTISSINYGGDDTATNPAGGATITLTGTNFASGARVLINQTPVSVVTVVSSTQITFTAPALAAGSYILYVVNLDGSTAIAVPGIQYSGTPAWTTAAGSLGTGYETAPVSTTVAATSDSTVTYSVVSGTLPSGVTINASGTISGTSPAVGGSTTYTFTVRATDLELQDTDRQFSLTINPDVVTWSSSNAFALEQNAASTTTLSATSAAGQTVSYSVDTLPAGLTLSGATVSGTATTAGTTTTVATATAAVTGKTAQQTITWTVSIAADAYWKYTTLLLNAETSAQPFLADASANNFQLTAYGDARPSNFGPYTPGYYSVALDSQRHLSTPANSAFDFGSDDFTVEAWVYFKTYNSMQYSGHTIATNYENNNGWNFGFGGQNGIDGLGISTYSGNNLATSVSATAVNSSIVPLNKWHHVAVTKSGSTVRIFVNGVGYATSGTYTAVGAGGRFAIGVYQQNMTYSGNPNWNISNLRVVKGTAVYTADFTPSIIPLTAVTGTSLLACQGNRFVDASANAFVLTASSSSNISVSSFVPFQPNSSYSTYGSTYFDGTGDYVTYTGGSTTTLSADFTLECWVYLNNLSANQPIICIGDGYNLGALFFIDTAGKLRLYANNVQILTGTGTAVANTWNHVAFVRSGTTVTAYLNGVAGGTATSSSQWSGTTTYIGREIYNTGAGIQLAGYLTDLRLVKGTAVYTTSFTPPTQPLTAVTNTSLLTCQTNQPHTNSQFLDNSTSALTITRTGNAIQGAFSPYGANWSMNCSTASDNTNYISTPASGNLRLDQGNWTLEFWVYLTAWNTNNRLFDTGDNGSSAAMVIQVFNTGQLSFGIPAPGTAVATGTGVITLNKWYHIAITSEGAGANGRIYVDGVLQAGPTNYSNPSSTSPQFNIGRNNVAAGDWDGLQGYMSNFRFVSGQRLYTANFTPQTTPLLNNKYSTDGGITLSNITGTCQLLTLQNQNYVDNSLNSFAITVTGTGLSLQKFSPFSLVTQTPTTHSVYFDGTGDYIVSPATAANQLTGDFTVECWFNATGISGQSGLVSIAGATSSNSTGVHIYLESNSKVYMQITNTSNTFASSTTIASGWNHVAVVRSGSNNTLYLNGTSVATSTVTPNWAATPAISIGKAYLDAAFTNFNGYISNVRIVKDTAVYTSNFTPSTQPLTAVSGTSLLTCQDAVIRDNSANNFTLTAVGNAAPRRQNPFGSTTGSAQDYTPAIFGSTAYFDGTGDYLQVTTASTAYNLTGDFTMEAWVYPTRLNANDFFPIDARASGATANPWLFGLTNSSGYKLRLFTGSEYYGTSTIPLNAWTHIAWERSGSTLSGYVNGVREYYNTSFGTGSISPGSTAPRINSKDLELGSQYDAQGYMTDIRLVNGSAVYKGPFAPPSAPLQAVQNTTLLLNMDRAAISDKSGKVVAETVGDAKVSTSVRKYGTSSLYFDGTGDYLTFPSNPQYAFGTGDFTIECWVNSADVSPSQRGFLQTSATAGGFQTTYTSGITFLFGAGASGGSAVSLNGGVVSNIAGTYVGSSTAVITANTWTHLALVRSNGTATMYVNGVSVGSATATGNCTGTNLVVGGYYSTGYVYGGYIDDLRITKGYARYTANFTPPAQALLTK